MVRHKNTVMGELRLIRRTVESRAIAVVIGLYLWLAYYGDIHQQVKAFIETITINLLMVDTMGYADNKTQPCPWLWISHSNHGLDNDPISHALRQCHLYISVVSVVHCLLSVIFENQENFMHPAKDQYFHVYVWRSYKRILVRYRIPTANSNN